MIIWCRNTIGDISITRIDGHRNYLVDALGGDNYYDEAFSMSLHAMVQFVRFIQLNSSYATLRWCKESILRKISQQTIELQELFRRM